MKKFLKISGITLGVIILIITIGAIIAPPIAKNYINKHGKELIGRKVQINGLYSNLFTGYNRITDFTLYETDDTTSFVTFDTLIVDISLYRILANELRVNEITLVNPQLKVWQEDELFNFSDILKATDTTNLDTIPQDSIQSSSMSIALSNINLRQGRVLYKDRVRQSTWDMKDMNLHIPGVYFSGKNTNVGINLNFSNGGSLQTQTEYNLENGDYLVHLNLQNLAIDNLQPYLSDYLKISKLNGLFSAAIDIAGNVNHVLDLTVKGMTSLKHLSLTDLQNKQVLTLDSAHMDIQEINPSTNTFYFNSLAIKGLQSSFDLYKDHNNITDLLKETATDTTATTTSITDSVAEQPMQLRLNKLDLADFAFTFNDHTLGKPFSFPMTNISIQANDLTLSGTNHIIMAMNMGKGGIAHLNWKGKLDNISNLNLSIIIKNVGLQTFDPYCLQYFGYPISKGTLAFSSTNVISNNMLEGRNSLDAFRFELENKKKDLKPEYNLPLKTALYLIKDRNDKINMDLPVKGNISSPEFSYRKLIFKTLTNLLVKVAMSPVSFMANSLGLSPDKLEAIPLDACQWDFTSEQYSTLNDLVTILKSKPEMTLVLEQEINVPMAKEELALYNAKKRYYLSIHPEKTDSTLVAIDYAKINEIGLKDPAFNTYLSTLVETQYQNSSVTKKALTLVPEDKLQEQVTRFINLRNRKALSYLTSQEIPEANLRVETIKPELLNTYTGKNQYKINLVLAGDEQQPTEE